MDSYVLPKIAIGKIDPSNVKKLKVEAKASKVEKSVKNSQIEENNRQEGERKKVEDKGREDVVRASVKEQEKEKMMEAEVMTMSRKITHLKDCIPNFVTNLSQGSSDVGPSMCNESFQLDLGEFPLDAIFVGNGPYAKTIASKLVFPADAKRFGNTSDALRADRLITASIVTNQVSYKAARRLLAVEAREKKYEEDIILLTRQVLEMESRHVDATSLCELTKVELDLSLAKVKVLESARKKDGSELRLKKYRIKELELELKSKQEAAEKDKEEALNAAYQHFIEGLAKRDKFLATKYYTQGRNSAKIQIQERPELEFSEVEVDSDDDDCQSDVELKAEKSIGKKYEEKNKPLEAIHADRSHKLLIPVDVDDRAANVQGGSVHLMTEDVNDAEDTMDELLNASVSDVAYRISKRSDDVCETLHTIPCERKGEEDVGVYVQEHVVSEINDYFLPRHYATTDTILAANEQRQSGPNDESGKDEKMEDEVNEKSVQDRSEYEKYCYSEEERNKSEDKSAEDTKKRKQLSTQLSEEKESAGKKKVREVPTVPEKPSPTAELTVRRSLGVHSKVDGSDESSKELLRKKKQVNIAETEPSTTLKPAPKERRGKEVLREMETPTDTELRDTIHEILKKVDFDTATFPNILTGLGNTFKKDLNPRKPSIKLMFEAELTKLARASK